MDYTASKEHFAWPLLCYNINAKQTYGIITIAGVSVKCVSFCGCPLAPAVYLMNHMILATLKKCIGLYGVRKHRVLITVLAAAIVKFHCFRSNEQL